MAATWLADALRAGGLPVDETLVPDWKNRGHTDGPFEPLGVLGHHTAGGASGDLPSLRIVRDGRADLAGPLANLMLSRAGVFVPIAAGRAWHAGAPDNPGRFPWVPNGDGNGYLIGIEAESTGTSDDWTPAQRENYPKGVAALLRHMGQTQDRFLGHKEWAPLRKIDPAFWDLNDFRLAVGGWLLGTGNGGAGSNVPTPPAPVDASTFGLPAGHYWGLISGPDRSHGGINDWERAHVRRIQEALQAQGYAPKAPGWADGVFEQPTADAVAAFQHARMPGTQFYGQVWADDWAVLVDGHPSPAPPAPAVPPFPLPRGHYFGLITGPAQSHGGFYASEKGWVRMIQEALQRKGYAPRTPGWADGVFEAPTANAVAAWQRDHMPGTQFYGQVWADDWANLLA